jgi:hypothetical protein
MWPHTTCVPNHDSNIGEGLTNNLTDVVLACALLHGGCMGSIMGTVLRDVAHMGSVRRRRNSKRTIFGNDNFALSNRPFQEGIVRGRT